MHVVRLLLGDLFLGCSAFWIAELRPQGRGCIPVTCETSAFGTHTLPTYQGFMSIESHDEFRQKP